MAATAKQIHTHAAHIEPPADAPLPRPRSKSVYPPLPHDPAAFCRLQQILEFSGMGRSRFYALMAAGKMPRPIKVGRSSVWRVGLVRAAVEKLAQEGA